MLAFAQRWVAGATDLDHLAQGEVERPVGRDLRRQYGLALDSQLDAIERNLFAVDRHPAQRYHPRVAEAILELEGEAAGAVLQAAEGVQLLQDERRNLHDRF